VEDERLDAIALPDVRRRGFSIIDFSVHLRGTCAECRRGSDLSEQTGEGDSSTC
jgi:hypothetical protein